MPRLILRLALASLWLVTSAALPRIAAGAPAPREAPNAVVLSNGQRWERISLRHIDVRLLAPLFGATILPPEHPFVASHWLGAGPGTLLMGGPLGPALSAGMVAIGAGPGGVIPPGSIVPRVPIIADPVTNSLIVDP